MNTKGANIQQLKLLPEDEVISFLLSEREDQWLDRASCKISAIELANKMIGFANAEGGLIVVGMHNGKVEGIQSQGKPNPWRQAAINFTLPPVRHGFELIDCINSKGQRDQIIVIEVEASERVHTNQRGETYLRVGDENRKLRSIEAQELMYDKGESNFDGSAVTNAKLSDFDPALVDKYLRKVKSKTSRQEVFRARGLAKDQHGQLVPTHAGLLILGKSPQSFLPQAHIRVLRYKGSVRETGERLNVVRDRRIEGPLSYQIDTVRRLLKRWLPRATRLGPKGQFTTATLVPEHVWLEAIVNAVIHRSYSVGGDHVRVEVFDDRLEIKSPGRLPGLVRLDNIRSTRFARNPRVARALSDLRYGRELGEGVNRMFEEMNRVGLPDPLFTQGSAFVQVNLLGDPWAGRVVRLLPHGSERFVEYLSIHRQITTAMAAELLSVTRPTARKHLQDLTRRGYLEHVGTSSMDPRGYWVFRPGV